MNRLADFRKQVIEGWTVQRIAAVLIFVGLVVFVAGVVDKHCPCAGWPNLGDTLNDVIGDFYANVSVDCLSVAFAILVIDRLNQRCTEQELKAQLIREMRNRDNGIALRAVDELWAHGWMEDGSLYRGSFPRANLQLAILGFADLRETEFMGANLRRANLMATNLEHALLYDADLQGAIVTEANLREANLQKANLKGTHLYGSDLSKADLRDADLLNAILVAKYDEDGWSVDEELENVALLIDQKLASVSRLRGATMTNGDRYNGRLNLHDDIEAAKEDGIDPNNSEAMALWYGVSMADYNQGQTGIDKDLSKLPNKDEELSRDGLIKAFLDMKQVASENVERLRREAGLDQDTGSRVELTNGTTPQAVEASAQSAPKRNGHRHKASMVIHRIQRRR